MRSSRNGRAQRMRGPLTAAPLVTVALLAAGCAQTGSSPDAASSAEETVEITGSATIQPIARIAGREAGVPTAIEAVGTLDGFERFCAGEADVNNASDRIPGQEGETDFQQSCEDNGVEYVELVIGMDAIVMVRHEDNDRVSDLTQEELEHIWRPESPAQTWSDVRGNWPDTALSRYGRDEGSGTFAVFTREVMGEPGEITEDYRDTDDLDQLARWVAEDPSGLAFMGVGNYLGAEEEVRNTITTVPVDGVPPGHRETVEGEYPLDRPLHMYVSLESLEQNPNVERYVTHLLQNGSEILPRAFFYPLDEGDYDQGLQRLRDRTTGPSAH